MTTTPTRRMTAKDVFNFDDIEERSPILRVAPMKRIKQELPGLSKATDEAQVLAHALHRLSGAVDPNITNAEDCLESLRIGGIRRILDKLNSNLEALGV